MRTLNLGAGNKIIKRSGWINHDLEQYKPGIDITWDLNRIPWPWEDNWFDCIVAISVLEHLKINLIESINECWRILTPGGVIHIKLPHWQSDSAYCDPTHYRTFATRVSDYFDPTTKLGHDYGFYTDRKWKIVRPSRLNKSCSSFVFKMKAIKP